MEEVQERRAKRREAGGGSGGKVSGGVLRPHEWASLFESLVEADDEYVAQLAEVVGREMAAHLDFFLRHRLAERYDALATLAMGVAVRALDHLSRTNSPLSVRGLVRGALLGRSGREAEDFLNTRLEQDESKAVRKKATVEGLLGRSGLVALDEQGQAEWYDFAGKERNASKYGYRLVPLAMAREAASVPLSQYGGDGGDELAFERRSEPPDVEFVKWFEGRGRSGFVEAVHLALLDTGDGEPVRVAERARDVLALGTVTLVGELGG